MNKKKLAVVFGISLIILMVMAGVAIATPSGQASTPQPGGLYRGVSTAVKFDVSPPLKSIKPIEVKPGAIKEIPDRPTGLEGAFGPQDADAALQTSYGPAAIPTPIVSFNGPSNISSVSPPDPVGDVGPNHYVAMSNLSFQIFNKTGTSLYGPALNNTLWAGFGGACQTENSGDPIVLYDQLDDRWILTQFTAAGPTYYNCVAVSTTGDPTGSYYRYAFSTGSNFPDYPKYGMWPDALYISTREFAGGSTFVGMGAYAINRSQLIAGNPAAQVISFLAAPGATPYNVGDGLLPADLDGNTLPPAGAPNYFVGSMDNGGPYSAPQDALTLWKFHVDFVTPANSFFTLANTIPIAAIDTIPAFCSGRACIPQPGTANKLDHLGYRQRPLWRLAYRNFGDHEALVTNQSVEASATMSGIRWWEIRSPNSSPVIYQEGTYAPGLSDGIHRWMGSLAMDSSGNMALGYSASDGTSTYPSLGYTGRLVGDPLGTLPQGEGSIIAGTGSQTGSNRWGDYTSMNVDPVDDCTFWYVNEYVPTTSSVGWQLRIGSFRFAQCGSPDFTVSAAPPSAAICAPASAAYTITVGSVSSFSNPVTLSVSAPPTNTTASFSVNPVTPVTTSLLTISNTGAAAAGSYNINVLGVSATRTHTTTVGLNLYTAMPGVPTLALPANGAININVQPTFTWTASSQAVSYTIEIATDVNFTNIVHTANVAGTSYNGASLSTNTTYFWRVRAANTCGTSTNSVTFNFKTQAGPGDCAAGSTANTLYSTGFETGAAGWTHSAAVGTDTWVVTTTNPHSGSQSWHADNLAVVSDQRLASPAIALPSGQNPVVLKFWHLPNLEPSGTTACYDGGILEVSANSGVTWTQVTNANLLAGAYRGAVSASFSNPLAGLQAWCGTTTYTNTIADVSSYAGQTVQFRFRLGTDTSVGNPGWNVDDVTVQSCRVNSAPGFVSVNTAPNPLNENQVITLTGVITDVDPLDTHTLNVNWGDGTLTETLPALGAGVYNFTAAHRYLDGTVPPTSNTVALTVSDGQAAPVFTTTTVTVNNVSPVFSGVQVTSPIAENDSATLTGVINEPGTLDTITLTVNWGDGSAAQTFPYPAGAKAFTQTHQYLDDDPSGTPSDIYPIGLTLTDKDTGSTITSTAITVNNLAPVVTAQAASTTVLAQVALQFTGAYTDTGTLDTHTINWDFGDGTTMSGTLTPTHIYTATGTYTTTLAVTDDDTGVDTDSLVITVTPWTVYLPLVLKIN